MSLTSAVVGTIVFAPGYATISFSRLIERLSGRASPTLSRALDERPTRTVLCLLQFGVGKRLGQGPPCPRSFSARPVRALRAKQSKSDDRPVVTAVATKDRKPGNVRIFPAFPSFLANSGGGTRTPDTRIMIPLL